MFNKLKIMWFPGYFIKRFNSRLAKRAFLLKQYEGTVKRIWGEEFVKNGFKQAREIVRREYDKLKEDVDAAKVAILQAENEAKEQLEKIIETKSREIEEIKKRIDYSDETIQNKAAEISAYRENLESLEKEIYQV